MHVPSVQLAVDELLAESQAAFSVTAAPPVQVTVVTLVAELYVPVATTLPEPFLNLIAPVESLSNE